MGEADASDEPEAVERTGTAAFRPEPGTLYVVATPLGNLRDLTLRAKDVLAGVDVVAAEDTRVTSVLLARYAIAARPTSLHEHNEARRAADLARALGEGKSVALVTDAGTPAISDPGARLVRAVRDAGHPVVPIPGPCAAIAAVSAAGLRAQWFAFVGFPPTRAKARDELLASLAPLPCAIVMYEAPHRVRATVTALAEALPGERTLVVARELTKKFETITAMPLGEAAKWMDADSNRQRGEFVLVVDAAVGTASLPAFGDAERLLRALLAELPPARAARVAAEATGLPRDELYARAVALKPNAG